MILPLSLEYTANTRDLGGYSTDYDKPTKFHKFLRSDSPCELKSKQWEYLMDYGVRLVIDLRSETEIERASYKVPDGMRYVNYHLIDNVNSNWFSGIYPDSMAESYIGLIDNSGRIFAEIFREMIMNCDYCTLYHCSAGKDRTGIISALLLLLCNVCKEQIREDYTCSALYMKEKFTIQSKLMSDEGLNVPAYVFESRLESIDSVLEHIKLQYGNIKNYMKTIGLTEEEIKKLQNILVD